MFLHYCFTFLKRGSLWTYRVATWTVLIVGAAFFALVIALRYLVLPHIDEYREPIAQAISRAVGQKVTIGSIAGSWQGYRPELTLGDVRLLEADGDAALALDKVETVLSWFSLLSAELRFDAIAVHGLSLEIRRDAQGAFRVAGIAVPHGGAGGGFGDWLLQQRQVVVRDASIAWLDEMRSAPKLLLEKADLRLDRDGRLHRFGLSATPPAALSSALVARGEFVGDSVAEMQSLNGRLYLDIGYLNLAMAQAWMPSPLPFTSGLGSMRLWLDLNGAQLGAATADLRFANVQARLAPDLPELALAEVHGRLGWKQREGSMEVSAESFGFTTTDGLRLEPARFAFSRAATAGGVHRSQIHVSGLQLAPLAQLAGFLPIDPGLRARVARVTPTGSLDDVTVSWSGDWGGGGAYAASGQVSGLAVKADGTLPGFHGLSGRFDANETGGTAALNVNAGGVELPTVLAEPVPLDFSTVNLGWTLREGGVDIIVKNASFANEHLAGSVSGTWRSAQGGAGSADLSGILVRADVHQLWRYVPATKPATRAWMKRALVAGQSRDTKFRLQGPLSDFPFANDHNGVFEVVSHVAGVSIDYADGWTPVTGFAGEIAFRGDRMDVRGQSGAILGLQLANVEASIDELGKQDEVLHLKGEARGQTADFLKFIAATPVTTYMNHFTDSMKATGNARLAAALDIPLHRSKESRVKGELVIENNGVVLDSRLPPFDNFGARIAFTEHGFAITQGRALMFGEPLSFEAGNQADGGVTASVSGTLDVDQARTVWSHPLLARLDGQAQWRGSVAVRNKISTIRFESSLAGVKSSLPPPFAKAAPATLPLRIELRERAGRQGVLSVSLDKVATAQLLLDGAAASGVGRGTVSLGGQAALPSSDGLWIRGSIDTVDVDAWKALFAGGSDDAPPLLGGVDLQIGTLVFSHRVFHDLKVKATRDDDEWQATLHGDEVDGSVTWLSGGDGKVTARLSSLALPPPVAEVQGAKAPTRDERLPSVDLVADDFTYEDKPLGKLTVLAQPEPAGWRLQKLELANPDAKFSMNGRWVIAEASRTDVTVRLDVADVGKFFGRLGWPDSMQGGTATLEGPLAWTGNPTRLDIPSLSGQLKLEAKNGRFKQIEPGVAKLLGILSLQALPRRVSLDFRDVFSKGFSFDHITSDLQIKAGVAETTNFLMQGSSARVAMQGKVDLAHERQDLLVRVTPSLSEGIAIAGAIVNPAIGVAALLAQKALKDPFSQIASFDYSVTGSWADPAIARVQRPVLKEKGR